MFALLNTARRLLAPCVINFRCNARPQLRRVDSLVLLRSRNYFYKAFERRRGMYYCDLDEAEPLEYYSADGYHPVHIGDEFDNGKYKVLHKLGSGAFSTVWLARDYQCNRNVAIKFIVSSPSREVAREVETMRAISDADPYTSGRQHVIKMFDEFSHSGPNGTHTCLVLELLGPSVATVAADFFDDERLSSDLARIISRQTLFGLHFLHTHSITHGDIHPGNLALTAPKLEHLSEEALMRFVGTPQLHEVSRNDGGTHEPGVPKYLVWPSAYAKPDLSTSCCVKIIDFGNSFTSDRIPSDLPTPMGVRAPEVALGVSFDHRVDLWSVGCTIFELFAGQPAFESFLGTNMPLIRDMVEKLGPLLEKWQCLYTPPLPSNVTGDFLDGEEDKLYTFQEWLELLYFDDAKSHKMSKEEIVELGCILRQLIQYEPQHRATALDIAESKFFTSQSSNARNWLNWWK